jgi:protein-disulfide isomerase
MALPVESDRLIPSVSQRDHCQGSPTAKVTLVQYGDYQCLECQEAQHLIISIQQQLGEQVRFVFRHFPRSEIHSEAYQAAEAVEAAASQNKFWEMHHHLLKQQSKLADSNLVEYAIELYLDVDLFLAEMASDRHMARVQADIESGIQSGVTKTPTFFVNGLKYSDDRSLESLTEAVLQACHQ